MKEALSNKGLEFAYFDISDNITYLKKWLKIRDTHEDFEVVRENHKVGLPFLDIDGKIYVNNLEELIEKM